LALFGIASDDGVVIAVLVLVFLGGASSGQETPVIRYKAYCYVMPKRKFGLLK